MGKKMKLPFLFKTSSESWPWPTSCGFIGNPKTFSFRADNANDNNTMVDEYSVMCSESQAESSSLELYDGDDCVENVIRGLRLSERLFFEPGGGRSSKLLEEEESSSRTRTVGTLGIERVEMETASRNPYVDSGAGAVGPLGIQGVEMEMATRGPCVDSGMGGAVGTLGIESVEMEIASRNHYVDSRAGVVGPVGIEGMEMEMATRSPRVDSGTGGVVGTLEIESVEMEIASRNPFSDFKRSMEEMVEAHGYHQDWKFLEELLACYLRINGKTSHGYIVGAFVDLLVELFMDQSLLANETDNEVDTIVASSSSSMASSSSSSSSSSSFTSSSNTYGHCLLSSSSSSTITHSFTSPLSFCSSLSSLLEEAEDEIDEKSIHNASSSSSSPPHLV